MKCQKCGHSLPEDSEFCQYCGTHLEPEQSFFEESPAAPSESAAILAEAVPPIGTLAVEQPRHASSNRKQALIPIVLLSVLFAVSVCFNVMQYIQGKEIAETVASQAEKIRELEGTVTDDNFKISVQEAIISEQKATIASLEREKGYFDAICEELRSGNIGYASKNFKSSEDVIVVKQKERDRKFTLTANWTDGGTAFVDYSHSDVATVAFDSDSWTTSTKMTVQPWRLGVTAVTFSNDVNSQTFKVLIIVTE